ncbi:MAG: hypothetical protein QOJ89_3809 [bacterium]
MIAILASSTGSAVAMALGGIAAVVVVSAVFYLVGRGEDRDRAASAAAREDEHGDEPPAPPKPPEPVEPVEAPAAAATRSRAPRATRRRPRR